MTRFKVAQALTAVSALGFLAAGAMHTWQTRGVVFQASQGFSGQGPLVATLWLAYAGGLFVLGLIVGLVTVGRVGGAKWLLALAACFPLVTVLLQLNFLGFTSSTAMLAAVTVVTGAAAIAYPGGS